jgi:hypothetical protein
MSIRRRLADRVYVAGVTATAAVIIGGVIMLSVVKDIDRLIRGEQ